jgi:hypothetical protein
MYRIHPGAGVIRTSDGAHITRTSPEWGEYQDWVKAGNVPAPHVPDPEPLADMCDRLRSLVNQERDRREQSGFEYLGKRIDSDQASAIRISGAAAAAHAALATAQPFAVEWTCADNSLLPLDAAQTIGMLAALAVHANDVHQRARQMKGRIDELFEAGDRVALVALDPRVWPGDSGEERVGGMDH